MSLIRWIWTLGVFVTMAACSTRSLPHHPWPEDNRLEEARWAVQAMADAAVQGDEARACRHITQDTAFWLSVDDVGRELTGDTTCMMLMEKFASFQQTSDKTAQKPFDVRTFAPVDFTDKTKRTLPPDWLRPRAKSMGKRDVLALVALPDETLVVQLHQDSRYDWNVLGLLFASETIE